MEPGRPMKTDRLAILDDAVRVLNQLKTGAKELKETNEKLLEEIKCSKVSLFQRFMVVSCILHCNFCSWNSYHTTSYTI